MSAILERDDDKVIGEVFSGGSLREQTYSSFKEIYDVCSLAGFKHLWRVWNFIPAITQTEGKEIRYRIFNAARYQAVIDCNQLDNIPASTGIGSYGRSLRIFFMAGKEPVTPVENSRQISAYNYPANYGKIPPLFSRGTFINTKDDCYMFVSGTASIVKSETMHPGNVALQTYETINNVKALVEEAIKKGANTGLSKLCYQVYVKRAADLEEVKKIVDEQLPFQNVRYSQNDICRDDLLVEIEATSNSVPLVQSFVFDRQRAP